ncbi:TIGR02444 family protein [Pantoea sp. Ap-967]|uniref:TIGR02444 family protein n=1 Tax=Pantoea sp. Ap-967 TaxID=2608362 RepID=UPI00141DAF8A|nr:TIGR02444 family protein [Pantoea sp. Ap-967]NIE75394.1 TIGR02444 family protein [Pantoea sp. Ap-967]
MHTDLWNHALALYARPGVETACLQLQALGGDVCLLLCATWLQRRAVAYSRDRAQALQALAESWQKEVVMPLRTLRQQWRDAAQQDAQLAVLREQLKGLELQAEKTLLQRLEACAQPWPSGAHGLEEDWLTRLAPDQARGHDALEQLRVAAAARQDAEDGA